jgi:vacuolar-type H+-ATPase subunit H
MTTEKPGNRPFETVEQAMNRVLQAERSAEQAVEACRHEALKVQQAAQLQASRIARRANERLALCHMRCNARLTRELKERERTAEAEISQSAASAIQLDEAALTPVVEALALDLTGIILPDSRPEET